MEPFWSCQIFLSVCYCPKVQIVTQKNEEDERNIQYFGDERVVSSNEVYSHLISVESAWLGRKFTNGSCNRGWQGKKRFLLEIQIRGIYYFLGDGKQFASMRQQWTRISRFTRF
jgi:hypothetical protein